MTPDIGRVTLGRTVGAHARITASLDGQNCPDLTLQLPVRDLSGNVLGAFQVQGWAWPDDITLYSVGLLGPRGGRHGTSVRLDLIGLKGLAIALRAISFEVDNGRTASTLSYGIDDLDVRETVQIAAARRGGVLGGQLWTQGVRGRPSPKLGPIHPEDLDHCSGLCRLATEIIG